MKQENRAHFKIKIDSSREAYRRAVLLFDCTPIDLLTSSLFFFIVPLETMWLYLTVKTNFRLIFC